MDNTRFWNSLKANWSTLQYQANNTKFDSELLKKQLQKQIDVAKEIRKNHYHNLDFLEFAEESEDE